MGKTRIPYANESWSPVTGCPPDEHNAICRERCWAAATARRFPKTHGGWRDCPACRDFRERLPGCNLCEPVPFSRLVLHEDRLSEPWHWKKPRVVFVAPMGDLFHDQVPEEFLDRVWQTMGDCCTDGHVFLVLTKRAERMRRYLETHSNQSARSPLWSSNRPLPNVWLGVTVWDQASADASIPLLLDTPAAHRWVSIEPMLGPVDLRPEWLGDLVCDGCGVSVPGPVGSVHQRWSGTDPELCGYAHGGVALDWVVVGAESGPNRRPMPWEWERAVGRQAQRGGASYYCKQRSVEPDGTGRVERYQASHIHLPAELAEVLLAP